MKHTVLPFLLLILTATIAWAGPVTQQQAFRKAQAFFAAKGVTLSSTAAAKAYRAPGTTVSSATAPYYVFNADNDCGFAIISGDDRTAPILGYVTQGSFRANDLPDNFRAWLEEYAKAIEYLQKSNAKVIAYSNAKDQKATISPLIKTKWNQDAPFNNACPDFFTYGKCVTGCVATAMAQLLYYHSQNNKSTATATTKEIPAYQCSTNWKGHGQISVPAIPAGQPLQWSKMLLSYDGYATDEQKSAVANLMYYCGAAVKMNYANSSNGGSSASGTQVSNALIDYFGFDKSTTVVNRSQYSIGDWNDLIYNELKNGRPVLYSGTSDQGSGHEFIIDGYQGDNYFDINWGWGGYCDGAFLLNVLAPQSGGEGAGNIGEGYNNDQQALIYAEPDHGGAAIKRANAKDFLISGSTLSYSLYYIGNEDATFSYGFGIRQDDGSIKPIGSPQRTRISKNYATGTISFDLSGAGLSTGTYVIVPIYQESGESTWQSMWSASKYIQATVDASGNIQLVEMPQYSLTAANFKVSNIRKANVPMNISVDITNHSDNTYTGPIYLFASTDPSAKGEAVATGKINVDAGATTALALSFTPSAAGTYTLWLCSDKGGNTVLATANDIVVGEGTLQGNALQLTDISVDNSDVTSTHEEGEYIVTNVSGRQITGKYKLKALKDIENQNVYTYLYKYDESTKSYRFYTSARNYNTISMGANNTLEFSFNYTGLTDGRYKLKIACGTLNTSTLEMSNLVWSDETYCYIIGTPTGIHSPASTANTTVKIYNLRGIMVAEVPADQVETRLLQLPYGVYFVNGKRIINK